MNPLFAWFGTIIAWCSAAVVAWSISSVTPALFNEIPVVWICVVAAFVVQMVGFLIAWIKQSEHFFDALGSLTFLTVCWIAIALSQAWSIRNLILGLMVSVWAVRLGLFLSARIHRTKVDRRFNQIRNDFSVFFMTWTLQGLWVTLTLAPALVLFTGNKASAFDVYFVIGAIVWVVGMTIEAIADNQKNKFSQDSDNKGKFITTGLWAWSQHPNYFGEIALWFGIALIVVPYLEGWQYLSLVSPIFVYLLLVHISGIRMLDARARRRWKDDEAYQEYVKRTPKLFLFPRG